MSVSVPSVEAKQTHYLRAGAIPGESTVWYCKTGEFRQPKKGEMYLCDQVPVVYEAHKDLLVDFWIVKPVPSPPFEVIVGGFIYKLRGPVK